MYIEGMTSDARHKDKNAMMVAGKTAHNLKAPKATAEQIRLAQIVNQGEKYDESQRLKDIEIEKIVEITGTTKESALFALYDANNDTNRAIELVLEQGAVGQSNGWETAKRKKNKTNTKTEEDKTEPPSPPTTGSWEKTESRGRGRKNKRGSDRNRSKVGAEDTNTEASTDRGSRGRPGGRGRGAGGRGRRGRGAAIPPRRFNRYNKNTSDRFNGGTQNETTENETRVETWNNPDEESWDLEVGTWTNEDSKKTNKTKKNAETNDNWGSESWNEDLSSTKVFQSQHAAGVISKPEVSPPVVSSAPPTNHMTNTTPQMGERIDIDTLFKKTNTAPLSSGDKSTYGTSFPSDARNGAPAVIQQLQQQGQSTSLFSENKLSGSSRLFGGYTPVSSDTGVQDIFNPTQQSSTADSSYTQFNDKLQSQQQQQSSFLGDLNKRLSHNSQQQTQNSRLLTDIPSKQNALSSFSQVRQSHPVSTQPDAVTFSEGQQQQATDAVKSSLGLPIGSISSAVSRPNQSVRGQALPSDVVTDTLSFGSPLPPRPTAQQINKQQQQRKKMPKIPAMAVEMPGSSSYNSHSLSNFSLQFGVDDSPATPQNNSQNQQQNALYHNSEMSSTNNHSRNEPSSMFNKSDDNGETLGGVQRTPYHSLQSSLSQEITSNEVMTDSTSILSSQRTNEDQPRVPPGLSLPSSGANMPSRSTDLESSYGSHQSGGQPLDGSLNRGQNMEGSSSYGSQHSYYSIPTSQQSQKMSGDLSASAGQSLRSPGPSNLPGSLQSSPMPKSLGGNSPNENENANTNALPSSISSLSNSLQQVGLDSHISSQDNDMHNAISSFIQSTSPSHALNDNSNIGNYGVQDLRTSSHNLPSTSPLGGYNSSVSSSHPSASSHSASTTSVNDSLSSTNQQLPTTTASASKSSSQSKAPPNIPPGVTPMLPGQYGIPMAGIMPYAAAAPDMAYAGYEQLLLQSRVHPLLSQNLYDVHFQAHNNPAVTMTNRDSNATANQTNVGGKFSRDHSNSPTSSPAGLVGSLSSGLSQHQSGQMKAGSQAAGHPQPFLSTLPAYPAGYSNLAPYYPAGGYQYPPTMFATAMHQPSKHSVNATTGFQQHGTGFNHSYTSASINASSSSGMQDLQGSNYSKNHNNAFDKQSFHQHTHTPPPAFNVQTITAAVAAGSGGGTPGGGNAGISPYAAAGPYMTMMPSQQIHLLQQHQDAAGAGQSIGSLRNQNSSAIGKTGNKPNAYGTPGYWGS